MDPAWRLCVVTSVNCMIVTSMYTLAPFAVLEFGATADRQAVGFWSGFIVASFFLSRAVTLPCWGRLADQRDRRCVICASLLLTGAGTLLCGFAESLEAVAACRFVTGACSAVHASCCALGFQLSGNRGSAIVESGFSFGRLLGPGLAGFLLRVPGLADFPLLWPCAVLAAAQLCVMPLVPRGPKEEAQALTSGDACDGAPDVAPAAARKAQFLSACFVLVSVAMEECFVLYAVGALAVDARLVGAVYLVAGAGDLLLQNACLIGLLRGAVPEALRRMRTVSLLLYGAAIVFLPLASRQWPLCSRIAWVGGLAGLRNAIAFVFFVSNMALLNEASAGRVAAAQSVRMAVGSAVQVVGPPLGATAYAWFATRAGSFPWNESTPFVASAVASLLLALCA